VRKSRKPSSSSASRRIVGRGLERTHLELQAVAVLLDAAEHANRVAFLEARVEQLDVVPDARLDAAALVDQLEREIRRTRAGSQAALARDRVGALDDPLGGQIGDGRGRAHWPHSRSEGGC
jgi:hypothetical protein